MKPGAEFVVQVLQTCLIGQDLLSKVWNNNREGKALFYTHQDVDFHGFDGVPRGGYNSINVIRRERGDG